MDEGRERGGEGEGRVERQEVKREGRGIERWGRQAGRTISSRTKSGRLFFCNNFGPFLLT